MYNTQDMHHIQKSIINDLAQSSPLRFSKLQPSSVPNNTFSYHLKKLLETGYVIATNEGYMATRKALKTLSYAEHGKKRFVRPITLTVLFVTNQRGEVLLIRRNTQPFKHYFGSPSGLIHDGETIESAARRELFEKTTIVADINSLQQQGILQFRYQEKESKDTFVNAVGFIYTYEYPGDPSSLSGYVSKYGELSWSKLDHTDILPEVHEISRIVTEGGLGIHSVDFDEPIELNIIAAFE